MGWPGPFGGAWTSKAKRLPAYSQLGASFCSFPHIGDTVPEGKTGRSCATKIPPNRIGDADHIKVASDGPLPLRPPFTSGTAAQADSGGRLMAKGAPLREGLCRPLAHCRNGQLGTALPRSRRGASHLRGQVRWRNRLWGYQGLPGCALWHPATDRPAPSSHGKDTTRMIRPAIADGL